MGVGSSRSTLKVNMMGHAGSTSILYKFVHPNEDIQHTPTIGYNVERFNYKHMKFEFWDMAGGIKMREIWHQSFNNSDCLIWVVNSSSRTQIEDSVEELYNLVLNHEISAGIPLLVVANKCDLPQTVPKDEIIEILHLKTLNNRVWDIIYTSIYDQHSLYKILDWIIDHSK